MRLFGLKKIYNHFSEWQHINRNQLRSAATTPQPTTTAAATPAAAGPKRARSRAPNGRNAKSCADRPIQQTRHAGTSKPGTRQATCVHSTELAHR